MSVEIAEVNWHLKAENPLKNVPNVLLVEDNIVALHLIETLAKQAGLEFTSAIDGEQAIECFKTTTFDLIITDIGLPGISGYELADHVRKLEKNMQRTPIPIIGLTALPLEEAKKGILQSGINDILSKPINLNVIQSLVKTYISCNKII
jgi:CheY-like chemotaxis protein